MTTARMRAAVDLDKTASEGAGQRDRSREDETNDWAYAAYGCGRGLSCRLFPFWHHNIRMVQPKPDARGTYKVLS